MRIQILTSILVACGWLAPMLGLAQEIRLAIVAESSELQPAADLLTAEMSAKPGLSLLERTQIDKILREQQLSVTSAQESLKLGQVLGADGLILLKSAKEGERSLLSARLVAVKPGVVLRVRHYPWPLEDSVQWSKVAAQQFQPLVPKLAVLAKDAIPISILNLRSSVTTSDSERVERELTSVLATCLSRRKEVFVLERRQMLLLEAEKERKAMEDSPFWNGSYLLEGTLDKSGVSPGMLTVTLVLRPAGRTTGEVVEVTGKRTNLVAIAETVVEQVLGALKLKGGGVPWEPAAEAKRYYEEGQWAYRWRMWDEAQAAAESSWALGNQSKDCAVLRLRSYQQKADTFWGGAFTSEQTQECVPSLEPDAEKIQLAKRGLQLFLDSSVGIESQQPKPDVAWFSLGLDMVETASRLLEHYYHCPKARAVVTPQLSELRAVVREVIAVQDGVAAAQGPAWLQQFQEMFVPVTTGGFIGRRHVHYVRAKWGCFWADRPEAQLEEYRKLILSGVLPWLRPMVLMRKPDRFWVFSMDVIEPLLLGLEDKDRRRIPLVWSNFVATLCADTNPAVQMEGFLFKLQYAAEGADLEAALGHTLEFLWETRQRFFSKEVSPQYLIDFAALIEGRLEGEDDAQKKNLRGRFAEWQARYKVAEEQSQLDLLRSLLRGGSGVRMDKLELFAQRHYTEAEAREILPLVERYKSEHGPEAAGLGPLESKLLACSTGKPATNAATSSIATPGGSHAPAYRKSSPFKGLGTNPPVIALARYWSPEGAPKGPQNNQEFFVSAARYRNGRLWVGTRQYIHGTKSARTARTYSFGFTLEIKEVITRINLQSWETEAYRVPLDPTEAPLVGVAPPALELGATRDLFDIVGGDLFTARSTNLCRYHFANKEWTDIPVPVQAGTRLTAIRDRLYLSGEDRIVEYDPASGATRILASTRRRPTASLLDALPSYGEAPIFSRSSGEVCTAVQNQIYSWSATTNDWVCVGPTPTPAGFAAWAQPVETGLLFHYFGSDRMQQTFYLTGSRPFELLFQHPAVLPWAPVFHQPRNNPARWKLPPQLYAVAQAADLDGEALWVLGPPLEATPSSLLYFSPQREEPVIVPLNCPETGGILCSSPNRHDFESPPGRIILTPEGLVLVRSLRPGFWFVPRAELDRCVATLERLPARELRQ